MNMYVFAGCRFLLQPIAERGMLRWVALYVHSEVINLAQSKESSICLFGS